MYEITALGKCPCLEDVPAYATIISIDGKKVVARCGCGQPIFEHESCECVNGVYFCKACMEEGIRPTSTFSPGIVRL